MKLYIDKTKSKITESLNGFSLEVDTAEPIVFTGSDGKEYMLYGECEEGLGAEIDKPFIVEFSEKKM